MQILGLLERKYRLSRLLFPFPEPGEGLGERAIELRLLARFLAQRTQDIPNHDKRLHPLPDGVFYEELSQC